VRSNGRCSNSRPSGSPSGWPGYPASEVVVANDCGDVEDSVQTCTCVASNASRDPSPSTPTTPRSFRLNQQMTPQHMQQVLRDTSPRSQEVLSHCRSLLSHGSKATPTEHVATSDVVTTPVTSSPLHAAAVPASPLPDAQSSRKSLPSRFSSPMFPSAHGHEAAVAAATAAVARTLSAASWRGSSPFAEVPKTLDQQTPMDQSKRKSLPSRTSSPMPKSPCTQGEERPPLERPPGSVAAAAAAAAAAAVAAATAAGFGSEWVASPGRGINLVQRPASLGPQRASSAGTRRQDPGRGAIYKGLDCIGISGGGMCGSLSARGLQGEAQSRALKPHSPASPLRKTMSSISARNSVSPSPRRIISSKGDARETCAGRIDALKSELDLLRSKTGTIRQQLQNFKASQSFLLSHNTAEAAEPREFRSAGGSPQG
jgi:hypothetical protein